MLRIFKFLIYGLIQLIELLEYRNLDIDENDISKKIMNTVELDDIEVWTDTGWHSASHIHTVQPYKVWRLRTSSGKFLECADNHIVFDQHLNEVFVKDLVKGNFIMTENGPERILEVIKTLNKVSMFDLTVDSTDHRYYTNGILSHNCVGFDTVIDVRYFKNGKQVDKKMLIGELYYKSLRCTRRLTFKEWLMYTIWKIYPKF